MSASFPFLFHHQLFLYQLYYYSVPLRQMLSPAVLCQYSSPAMLCCIQKCVVVSIDLLSERVEGLKGSVLKAAAFTQSASQLTIRPDLPTPLPFHSASSTWLP